MSHDYQADFTGSPLTCNTDFIPLGTPLPYVPYVADIPTNRLSPLNSNIVYTGIGVVSPLVNASFPCIAPSPPILHNNIQSFGSTSSTPYANHYPDFNQSNSSLLNFSAASADSVDRYSLVGYNTSPSTKPCGRDNKVGWYDIHNKHVLMASRIPAMVILCGDSIIAGLARYRGVWNKYFRPMNTVNCGIGGDRTQHVLWRMENMALPATVKYLVVHCGTNNVDRDSAQEIANGVMSCGLVLQDQNPKLNVIITGLLPRDLENSRRRYKIIETNKYLKQYCVQFSNFSYMKQDKDWVLENGLLNEQLYYDDHLHLVESGNHKFAASISNIITKLSNNEQVNYSSDEEVSITFERVQSKARPDTPETETTFERSLEVTEESGVHRKKRKRHSSSATSINKPSTSQKRRRSEYLDNKELSHEYSSTRLTDTPNKYLHEDSSNFLTDTPNKYSHEDPSTFLTDTPKKYSEKRKLKKKSKKEEFAVVKELQLDMDNETLQTSVVKELQHDMGNETLQTSVQATTEDEYLEGTVKSIDISLADGDRRLARKAKFCDGPLDVELKNISDLSKACIRSNKPKTSAPSALVLKIRRSMEQARKELSKKKLAVSLQGYHSHGDSSQGESTPPNPKMKKLISDYGSGSDSE